MMKNSSNVKRPMQKQPKEEFPHQVHRYSKSKLMSKNIKIIVQQQQSLAKTITM